MPRQGLLNAVKAARQNKPYSGGTQAPKAGKNNYGVQRAQPKYPKWDNGGKWKGVAGSGKNAGQTTYYTPPASASSAPPPSAPPVGRPWDSTAERQWGAGEQKYHDIYAELEGSWKAREDYYGLGLTKSPYSQAALMERQHEVNSRSNLNSIGNQLYSGSLLNRQSGTDRRFDVGIEGLRAAYSADKEANELSKTKAQHEWEREQGEISEEAVQRAEEAEPPPAPVAEGGGGGGGGGGGASLPGLGGDPQHPNAYKAGVGAGKNKPKAPPGYHAYVGPGNQWWFAPN